ncbi:hypothetical protein [Goodfellowiella coeruleoviolacea]|uniref:hypothetical protein n=1 Tax=Goodfellowiella coeruleoviolacea TaxID=334858 RepID=UPI0020A56942|nr:hypothetical protein [Goodfellowiella coeruleoviolacea]
MSHDSSRSPVAVPRKDTGNDVRVFVLSAALPLAAGLLLLDAYGLMGVAGVVVGGVACLCFGVWWLNRYRALVPRRPSTQLTVWVGVLAAVLAVVAFALG